MAKEVMWTHNRNASGNYWTWRCDKCGDSNLEKYKICINCIRGRRPERSEDNSMEIRPRRRGRGT